MSIDTNHYSNAEAIVSGLCNILVENLDRHAPERNYKPRLCKSEPWITPDILAAKKKTNSWKAYESHLSNSAQTDLYRTALCSEHHDKRGKT